MCSYIKPFHNDLMSHDSQQHQLILTMGSWKNIPLNFTSLLPTKTTTTTNGTKKKGSIINLIKSTTKTSTVKIKESKTEHFPLRLGIRGNVCSPLLYNIILEVLNNAIRQEKKKDWWGSEEGRKKKERERNREGGGERRKNEKKHVYWKGKS